MFAPERACHYSVEEIIVEMLETDRSNNLWYIIICAVDAAVLDSYTGTTTTQYSIYGVHFAGHECLNGSSRATQPFS